MLKLRGSGYSISVGSADTARRIVRLSTEELRPSPLKRSEAFLCKGGNVPDGFAWYVQVGQHKTELPDNANVVHLPDDFEYLGDGDVLRLDSARGRLAVMFHHAARHHSFLLTERCNHYCLMCSQPPRDVMDDWIFDDVMTAIPLIDTGTHEIGFTGGEPTLLGNRLVKLIWHCKSYLPNTGVHVLTNGRAFVDLAYCQEFATIKHPDFMFGIPIYSDISNKHDYVVQADGAFDETLRGILNLKRCGLRVEIRVVIHKQTYDRLPQLARFISRNLTFVDQVVLMGLEMTGFTRANLDSLWIDPVDYQRELVEAVKLLAAGRITVGVYNHQLCITDRSIWPYVKRSISDWKNEYMPECNDCALRAQCGGFFSSAKLRYSSHIKALVAS